MSTRIQVVVTGGAGFIGSNLVRRLCDNPVICRIIVVDDYSTGCGAFPVSDFPKVTVVRGSVLNREILDAALKDAAAVVHLAALPSVPRSLHKPLQSHHANATGTLEVLEAARRAGNPMVIAASSSSVYGAQPEVPKAECCPPMPLNPYAVTKLATEAYLGAYHASFGIPVLPLRLFNVYGPGQRPGHPYAAVIPTFVDAALAGRPLPVHGDGTQTRDWTYVDSVCQVIEAAIVNSIAYPWPVNLGFGTRISLQVVVAELAELLGTGITVEHSPPRQGDVDHSQADPTRLRSLFPSITPVSLRDGLERTIAWHRSLSMRSRTEEVRCTS